MQHGAPVGDDVAAAGGDDAVHHADGNDGPRQHEADGDRQATLRLEGEDGARGHERAEDDDADDAADDAMRGAGPAQQGAGEQEQAAGQGDGGGDHMDLQGLEPDVFEGGPPAAGLQRQLLDHEGGQLLVVEVDAATEGDERRADDEGDDDDRAQGGVTEQVPQRDHAGMIRAARRSGS